MLLFCRIFKNLLTTEKKYDKLNKSLRGREKRGRKNPENFLKTLLTNRKAYDIMDKLTR